jgi:hypothetical protein
MSRHIPRHERWERHGPNEYHSGDAVVRFEKGAWWAVLSYRRLPEGAAVNVPEAWEQHRDRLGPFKRPRNAMIAAEDRAVLLGRRHAGRVQLDCPVLKSQGG